MKSNAELFNMTVLVVDDDDEFRCTLVEHLQNDHFTVLATRSSSEACKWIRGGRVSLVLLDWDLHKGKSVKDSRTGLEVLRASREFRPLLPVIVISGTTDYDARYDSMMWDADSFIAKPFSFALLTKHLARWADRVQAEENPFTQLASGVIQTVEMVTQAYTRAAVEQVGSALQAAPKLGLSRQTIASYLAAGRPLPSSRRSP
jgi:DNA-binding response OmpR family regulator